MINLSLQSSQPINLLHYCILSPFQSASISPFQSAVHFPILKCIHFLILKVASIIIIMGLTDSKQILSNIQSEYKSLRKYCDPVYGETTIIQHKTSKRCYAMIEKTFLKANNRIEEHVKERKGCSPSPYLLKLERFEVCDLSLCSDIRLYFFLFEYSSHTLEQELTNRQQASPSLPFTRDEALSVFQQQLEIAAFLKRTTNPETGKANRNQMGNRHFLCSPLLELRAIEPVFRIESEGMEEGSNGTYLSPEAYLIGRQGENYRMREISQRDSSVIFSIALNFLELLLLADLSMLYEEEAFSFKRLQGALEEVLDTYGEDIYLLLVRMTLEDERARIGFEDVRKAVRLMRRGKGRGKSRERESSFEGM